MTPTYGAGIAIAQRQGLLYFNPEVKSFDQYKGCGDLRSHMIPKLRTKNPLTNYTNSTFLTAVYPNNEFLTAEQLITFIATGTVNKPLIPSDERDSTSKYYYGPVEDFAKYNVVRNNVIYGNQIGVYVADDNNVVTGNTFHNSEITQRNIQFDVFVGNKARDYVGRPVVGLSVSNNSYFVRVGKNTYSVKSNNSQYNRLLYSAKLNAFSSAETASKSVGWSSERLSTFKKAEDSFTNRLIKFNEEYWK